MVLRFSGWCHENHLYLVRQLVLYKRTQHEKLASAGGQVTHLVRGSMALRKPD